MALVGSVHSIVEGEMIYCTPMKPAVFIGAIFLSLLLLSCSKETSRKGGSSGAETGSTLTETTRELTRKPEETMTMDLLESSESEPGAEEEVPKPPLPGREFLLVVKSGQSVPGEDLVIGTLHNVYEAEQAEQNVYRIIEQFLSSLVEGAMDEDVVDPESAQYLLRLLEYHFENQNLPEDFRVGEIFIADNSGRADIRLFGGTGRAAGEIFCTETESGWYVTDLQIDLSELNEPYEIEGPYEPNVYRWIHQF